MVRESVESCLQSLSKLRPKGTLIYLSLREAFFNKALSPLERIDLMWKTFFSPEFGDHGSQKMDMI